jgi:hypothetical protein
VHVFTWILLLAVPVLYGLLWWLDYRWLAHSREQELAAAPTFDDEEDAF